MTSRSLETLCGFFFLFLYKSSTKASSKDSSEQSSKGVFFCYSSRCSWNETSERHGSDWHFQPAMETWTHGDTPDFSEKQLMYCKAIWRVLYQHAFLGVGSVFWQDTLLLEIANWRSLGTSVLFLNLAQSMIHKITYVLDSEQWNAICASSSSDKCISFIVRRVEAILLEDPNRDPRGSVCIHYNCLRHSKRILYFHLRLVVSHFTKKWWLFTRYIHDCQISKGSTLI